MFNENHGLSFLKKEFILEEHIPRKVENFLPNPLPLYETQIINTFFSSMISANQDKV